MPRPRWQNLDPDKRRTVIDAAAAEFGANGFDGASYNRIIAKAGLSKGAMYYYFDDKKDLYDTVMTRAVERFQEAMGDLGPFDDADGFWEEFRSLLERANRFKVENPDFMALGASFLRTIADSGTRRHIADMHGGFADFMEEVFTRGQEVGAVRRDMPAGLLVSMAFGALESIQLWIVTHVDDLPSMKPELAGEFGVHFYKRLLAPGPDDGLFDALFHLDEGGKSE